MDKLTTIIANQVREMEEDDFKLLGPLILTENLLRHPERNFIQTDEGTKPIPRKIDTVEKYLKNERVRSFYELLTVLDEEQLDDFINEFTTISLERFRPS